VIDIPASIEQDEPNNLVGKFTTDVTQLANRIRAEAETYRNLELTDKSDNLRLESIQAISAFKYVNTLVSAPLRLQVSADIANEYDGQRILDNGVGICGQQIEAMIALFDAMKFQSRMIQMSWDHDGMSVSHVACEVLLPTGWAYLDASFGMMVCRGENIYDLVSLADIVTDLDAYQVLRSSWDPWLHQWTKNFGDPVGALPLAKDWDVTMDGTGSIIVPFKDNLAHFDARLNFVGQHARNNGRFGNHAIIFEVPEGYDLEIEFGAATFYDGKPGHLVVRDIETVLFESNIDRALGTVALTNIVGCVHVSVLGLDVCTVVINSARLIPGHGASPIEKLN
jgi:hypothetical protein